MTIRSRAARVAVTSLGVGLAFIACSQNSGYSATTCAEFATDLGNRLDEKLLDTGFDPDRPVVTNAIFSLLASESNKLGPAMAKATADNCAVGGFVDRVIAQLSPRARRVAFTHSASQVDASRAMARFEEWEDFFRGFIAPVLPVRVENR
ncbi:MAG: hypothetical protein H0U92_08135 [Actinobacteria bacterium]|nr:hypothetical protein [Actinomycetota bacterium]